MINKIRKLSFLSKIFVFVLPVIIVLCFLAGSFFALGAIIDTKGEIKKVNQYIERIESLQNDSQLMSNEHFETLNKLFGNLNYSQIYYKRFVYIKMFLATPDGEILDLEQVMLTKYPSGSNTAEPIDYVIENGQVGKTYTLHIVELNSFITNTPIQNEDTIVQFPFDQTFKTSGSIANIQNNAIVPTQTIIKNNVIFDKVTVPYSGSQYSHLKITFTLNSNMICYFEPDWSSWWQAVVALTSLSLHI